MLLDEYEVVPYKVLNYLGAEINYGGRVTDDKDVRLIKTILAKYVTPDVFRPDYSFSPSNIYFVPNATKHAEFVNYIENLPLAPTP
jgi:dynein heavy chain, axonemal